MQAAPATAGGNPFVDYLNSLRTQQAEGNPSYVHETRQVFLDALRARWRWLPSADALHVPGRLDGLLEALRQGQVPARVVFLTGDAGDGKTALCARLAAALGLSTPLGPVTSIREWTIIKDASEVPEQDLRSCVGQHLVPSDGDPRLVVAINEGRLRRLFRQPFAGKPHLWDRVIAPAIDAGLDGDGAARLDEAIQDDGVLVINFRHRFHVRSLLRPLLETWTRPGLWEEGPGCSACPARAHCPILANATSLRETGPRQHLADLLTAVHFSGQRLPFRRLQAVLALAATGGLSCRDILRGPLRPGSATLDRIRYRFYDAIFRSDAGGPVAVQPELLTLSLVPLDPGRTSSRTFDELVTSLLLSSDREENVSLDGLPLPAIEGEAVRALRKEMTVGSAEISSKVARLVRALRRWAALTGGRIPEGVFWREALRLLEEYAAQDAEKPLREAVVLALNQLHRVEGRKTDSLAAHQVDPGGFRDDARQGLEIDLGTEFETGLRKGPVLPPTQVRPWLEVCPSEIYFEAWPRGTSRSEAARLQLDTRLVSALLGVTAGYRSYGTLGAYRRDLARFFSQLAGLAARAGCRPAVSLRCRGSRVRVRTSQDQLRFDVEG